MYPIYYNIPYNSKINFIEIYVDGKFLIFNFVYMNTYKIKHKNKIFSKIYDKRDIYCFDNNNNIPDNISNINSITNDYLYNENSEDYEYYYFLRIDNDIEHAKLKMLVQDDEFDLKPFKFIDKDKD